MDQTIGGALLLGLAAIIIFIFVIMAAFFIGLGKSFRTKNAIINYVEQQEGSSITEMRTFTREKTMASVKACYSKVTHGSKTEGFTVKVVVYMKMNENILGDLVDIEIPIYGETRIIEKGNVFNKMVSEGSHFGTGDSYLKPCESGYTDL